MKLKLMKRNFQDKETDLTDIGRKNYTPRKLSRIIFLELNVNPICHGVLDSFWRGVTVGLN